MKFYSETLNKMFDTPEALNEAELEAKKAAIAKEEAAKAKKADAAVVEDAFKKLNAAKKAFNENFTELRKAYAKDLAELKKVFDEAVKEETDKLSEADKMYSEALAEFTKNHPEGYHMTLKDGDHVVTLRNNPKANAASLLSILDLWNDLFKI